LHDTSLSLGKAERDTSWHSLLMYLSRRASASDADEDFRSDLEVVTASWAAIRCCFRGHGIKQPRQLVLDPLVGPAIWLLLHSISRRPRWLDALRRVRPRVDATALFPRLDRGVPPHGTTSVRAPAHQVLLHEVIAGLRSSLSPVGRLFESGLWNQMRSTAPLCGWINKIRKHGLVRRSAQWRLTTCPFARQVKSRPAVWLCLVRRCQSDMYLRE
jgi:hypothetical protein